MGHSHGHRAFLSRLGAGRCKNAPVELQRRSVPDRRIRKKTQPDDRNPRSLHTFWPSASLVPIHAFTMSESEGSDFSGSVPNEEDLKMQQLLDEWDDQDAAKEEYVDSDGDEEDHQAAASIKAALAKKDDSSNAEDEEEAEAEDEPEAEDDSEDEAEDEEPAEEAEESESEGAGSDAEPVASENEESEKQEDDEPALKATDEESDGEDDESKDDDAPVVVKKKPKKKKSKSPSKTATDPSDDDNDEDQAMKALLATWDAEHGEEGGGDDDDEDDSDDSEASERELELEDNVVDHIVLAAADLEEAMAEFQKKTGVQPVIAGTIKGLGIKCARISFADASYLEIIAPDPKGPGPIGELIKNKKITELTPFHFAIRTSRAESLKDEVTKFGYTPDHITMFGSKADGTPRKWEMLYLYGHKMGGTCPFFINWANSDHPCATLPIVGKLKKLTIRAPEGDPVHQLLEHIGVEGITVETGKKKLSFQFKSPEGTIKFSTDKAVGFKFPGFEADVGAIPGDDGEQDAEVIFQDPKLPDLLPVSDADYEELPPPAY